MQKVDIALALSFVCEETAHSKVCDPVIMVKYLLVGSLCGIPTEEKAGKHLAHKTEKRKKKRIKMLKRKPKTPSQAGEPDRSGRGLAQGMYYPSTRPWIQTTVLSWTLR